MISFALGHICYLTAIYLKFYTGNLLTLLLPIGLAVAFALAAVLSGPLMKLKYGKFKGLSMLYAFLLSFMMFATGAALIVTRGKSVMWIVMFVGAVMFIISDLILSTMYFTERQVMQEDGSIIIERPKTMTPSLVILNHATYYIAQFLLAMSIFVYA